MRPYEEEWKASGEEVWRKDPDNEHSEQLIVVVRMGGEISDADAEARAVLIAEAPNLVRLLLKREYDSEEGHEAACGSCKMSAYSGLHRDDCEWFESMKRIGAR